MKPSSLYMCFDIGSTTVKAVVIDAARHIYYKNYKRHNTLQAEVLRKMIQEIYQTIQPVQPILLMTGSGGVSLAPVVGAQYVQEVIALMHAIETLYPDTGSVIELGGQGAKSILWKRDIHGNKRSTFSMNDRCAGGTGAMIDKILTKIGMPIDLVKQVQYNSKKIHPIAARCSVYAETDVVGLIKSGVSHEEIVISLANSIVKQNLEVLVRGSVLRDKVLLIGGPHAFIPCLIEAWQNQIPQTWNERKHIPADLPIEQLIYAPNDSEYFVAIGSAFYAQQENLVSNTAALNPIEALDRYLHADRKETLIKSGKVKRGLVESEAELSQFLKIYDRPAFVPPTLEKEAEVRAYLGIDGGSTSTKMVLLDEQGDMLKSEYMLSEGNPLADARKLLALLKNWVVDQGATLKILGVGTTGYASKIFKETYNADVAIVETIAHMMSCLKYYGEVDIICDVGGQDIKILFLRNGRVIDFRLNTQCSAGNGFFLHVMAEQFGIPVQKYAEHAFKAQMAPMFNYGCAVFMEQDKVDFQQAGWSKEEMMAGLVQVLPLNIWQYIVQEPNIGKWGNRIVLQGGTQRNLAAVKAQVDYLSTKVEDAKVVVHQFSAESGAIGAALEAKRVVESRGATSFIGMDEAIHIDFHATNDESTVCRFCTNRCRRTFVDTKTPSNRTTRFISGYLCDKGSVEDKNAMLGIEQEKKRMLKSTPNLVDEASRFVFSDFQFDPLPPSGSSYLIQRSNLKKAGILGRMERVQEVIEKPFERASDEILRWRASLTVGIPRLLNLYATAPFFTTFLRTLGVENILISDVTSQKLWNDGNKWGSIDPCFPAKVANAHIYHLMNQTVLKNKKPLDAILFPIIPHLYSHVKGEMANTACVIQMGTPEVVKSSFTKEMDYFKEYNIAYWNPVVNMERTNETFQAMRTYFKSRLKATDDEVYHATIQGFRAIDSYLQQLRQKGRVVIDHAVRHNQIIILMLGHPYHMDPGLNHGILDDFQLEGFPIMSIDSLPLDDDFLLPLFREELESGQISNTYDIFDVWKRSFNRNTNQSLWAAKIAARHPNFATIHFSNFKCGHDAPTYAFIESIAEEANTPHFMFHDLDQNKPASSIKLRIQTIGYYLNLICEQLKHLDHRSKKDLSMHASAISTLGYPEPLHEAIPLE